VGVAIYDRSANVGGLLHILLPEPTSFSIFGKPENYALTGMPIFMDALIKKGASVDNMEVVVAGGALVGPISKQDLNLDIGGRTLEIVERILGESGISLRVSETGGYFSSRLSLNLNNWECLIEPFSILDESVQGEFRKPSLEELKSSMESVRPIPQIALKIIRMLQDDMLSMKDIAKEIRQDQVISARVLRFCNSTFYHRSSKIDSIDRALVILGGKTLLQLVVSACLEDFFAQDKEGYSLCKGGVFNHALGTAMISEQLANLTGKVSGDVAYTAGLLHDIGKVALDQFMNKAFPLFYRRTQELNENLIKVESEVFGIAHTEAGSVLAKQWSLPDRLKDVIMNHHNPEQASVDLDLAHLVYLADLLMSRFLVGQELERLNTDLLKSRLKRVGLKPEQFQLVIESIPEQLFSLPISTLNQPQNIRG
jgi:putative nucleotidyltransferase with HDIG domain|tara:strand:+ start:927 stop:2204 length:1278 start_codon:yes stop_codon:yes gene_type:complete